MNILRMFGSAVIETASLVAQAPIVVGETLCLVGRDTSKGIKKAAEWSEEKCDSGVQGCRAARKAVAKLAFDKKLVIKIKTAKTSEELKKALNEEQAAAFQEEMKTKDADSIHPTVLLFYTKLDKLLEKESGAPKEEAPAPEGAATA